jgi:hypothetical protein
MKTWFLILSALFSFIPVALPQKTEEVYKKPLKEVLSEIEVRHGITIRYSENIVSGVDVMYPAWRYRTETESTLENILLPLDFVWQKTGDNVYQISKFVYYQRSPEDGKKHLDQLISAFPDLKSWELRKADLRKCILEEMKLAPLPRRTPLNPVYTKKRKMDGYTVENVAIETLPGVFLCGSLYRPSKGKVLFLQFFPAMVILTVRI